MKKRNVFFIMLFVLITLLASCKTFKMEVKVINKEVGSTADSSVYLYNAITPSRDTILVSVPEETVYTKVLPYKAMVSKNPRDRYAKLMRVIPPGSEN
jgi:hypothetical protein